MSEWKEYRLGDVCKRLSSGKNIKANLISSAGKYPVFGGNGLRGYTTMPNFKGDCAIIGRQGAMCGNVRYFSGEAYMTEHAIVLEANDKASTRFLAYLLSLMKLGRLSGQSAQPGLAVGVIANQYIKLPPLAEQKKIAAILSSLDEKIETNRKINARLEELAQALFKSWFIDFDPFGGKMPEDWEDAKIGHVSNLNKKQYSSKENWDSFQYLDTGNITENIIGELQHFSNQYELPSRARRKVKKFDIIYSTVRPNQRHLGLLLNPKRDWLVSTGFAVISAKESVINPFYLYMVISQKMISDYLQTLAEQATSTYPSVNASDIANLVIMVPNLEIQNQFGSIISKFYQQKYKLEEESARLAELRDTLLPKLMSGELIPE